MHLLETEEITEQKTRRIADLLEQLVLDMFLSALGKICENQEQTRESVCYKTNCPMRDGIPF
jgi:hypothetical protein